MVENPELSEKGIRVLLEYSKDLKCNYHMAIMKGIGAHPNTSRDILEAIEEEGAFYGLEGLAQNPNTSPEVLKRLATHPETDIRAALASIGPPEL